MSIGKTGETEKSTGKIPVHIHEQISKLRDQYLQESQRNFRLSKKLKEAWLEALRSGEYTKGNERLINPVHSSYEDPTHCCLGVLCEITIPETAERWRKAAFVDVPAYIPLSYTEDVFGEGIYYEAWRKTQFILSDLNDKNDDWEAVIIYIEEYL